MSTKELGVIKILPLMYYLWRMDRKTCWTLSRSWCVIEGEKFYICWTRNEKGNGVPHLGHTLLEAVKKGAKSVY